MEAFKTVARHPKVKEIVIKPKLDKGPQVDKYRSFMMAFVAEDRSAKICLADRKMAMAEVIPQVSIAVHDMFTTGQFRPSCLTFQRSWCSENRKRFQIA